MERVIRNIFTEFEAKKTICKDEHLAKQEFKKETDINYIVKSAMRNDEDLLQPVKIAQQIAIDLSKMPTYPEMLQKVIEAQQSFDQLDAKVRRRFNEDPAQLIEFLQDPANKPEGQKLGLIKPDPIIEEKKTAIVLDSPKA